MADAWEILQGSATDTADAIWERVVDGTYTAEEMIKLMAAALAGKASGAGSGTITFRDIADTKDRIVAEVDGTGNRTNVAVNGS